MNPTLPCLWSYKRECVCVCVRPEIVLIAAKMSSNKYHAFASNFLVNYLFYSNSVNEYRTYLQAKHRSDMFDRYPCRCCKLV